MARSTHAPYANLDHTSMRAAVHPMRPPPLGQPPAGRPVTLETLDHARYVVHKYPVQPLTTDLHLTWGMGSPTIGSLEIYAAGLFIHPMAGSARKCTDVASGHSSKKMY